MLTIKRSAVNVMSDFHQPSDDSIMLPIICVIVSGLLALLVGLQIRSAVGFWRAAVLGAGLGVLVVGSAWGVLERSWRSEPPPPNDLTTLPPVTSETCAKCHESHYASWHRTFHRTMTRDATPENVKGDFNDAVMTYNGVESTHDPEWETASSSTPSILPGRIMFSVRALPWRWPARSSAPRSP